MKKAIIALLVMLVLATSAFGIYVPEMDQPDMEELNDPTVKAMLAEEGVMVDGDTITTEEGKIEYTKTGAVITTEEGEVVVDKETGVVKATTADGEEVLVKTTKTMNKDGNMVVTPTSISVKDSEGEIMVTGTPAEVKTMLMNKGGISQVASKYGAVVVKPGKIVAGGVEVDTMESMTVNTPSGNVISITPGTGAVVIKDGNVQVKAAGISVEGNKVKVGNMEVKMPSEAIDEEDLAELESDLEDIELELEGDTPMYKYELKKQKKFLGLFGVEVGEQIKVNASSGEKVSVKGPWWSFMAFE